MSTRGEDDSQPSRPIISQRPTARDVPIAKYDREASSAPRGLRGPSLLPGQGAPERIVPEDIELAVLREADTLDGPHVARATARRLPDLTSSPAPTPVSVEVPRVRSVPPSLETYGTTPTTPSARSVQSGTLMSIGSVDPRAPTELSLPSPRALSQSERAAYLGPEAVVDRTPVSALPSAPRDLSAPTKGGAFAEDRQSTPHSEPMPFSSARSVPVGSGPPESSARRSQKTDSSAPHARHFGRAPQSYSPVAHAPEPSAPHSPERVSEPPSATDGPPRFQIHSELDAVPQEFVDDTFDLRSTATRREPLASRKPMDSSDWSTVHEPVSARRDSSVSSERGGSRDPSSSSAIRILVDPGQDVLGNLRASIPSALPTVPERASVPVSWVIGAAAFAVLLALIVAWIVRAPAVHEAARPADERAHTELTPASPATAPRSSQASSPSLKAPAENADTHGAPAAAPLPGSNPVSKAPLTVSAHSAEAPANSALNARPLAPSGHGDLHAAPPSATEAGAKTRQSIY